MKITLTFSTESDGPRFSGREFLASLVRPLTPKGFLWSVALPTFWLALFYTFVVHIRLSLGKWPEFGTNPGGVLLGLHGLTVYLVMVGLFLSFYALPVLAFSCLFFRRWRHLAIYLLAYAAAAALTLAAMHLAPGPFLNWFFD